MTKTTEELKKKQAACKHENIDAWDDDDSGDTTYTCEDCGEVFYGENDLQRLVKKEK
jgi:hypothetical protein